MAKKKATSKKKTASSKKKKASKKPPPSPRSSLGEGLKRGLFTSVFLLLILYIGLLAISRTKGFKSLITDAVEELVDMEVDIETVHFTPLLNLTLQQIKGERINPLAESRLRVSNAICRWNLREVFNRGRFGYTSFEINEPRLQLAQYQEHWLPKGMAPFTQYPAYFDPAQFEPTFKSFTGQHTTAITNHPLVRLFRHRRVVINDGECEWLASTPTQSLRLSGIYFSSTYLASPDHPSYECTLKIAEHRSTQAKGQDMFFEWLIRPGVVIHLLEEQPGFQARSRPPQATVPLSQDPSTRHYEKVLQDALEKE